MSMLNRQLKSLDEWSQLKFGSHRPSVDSFLRVMAENAPGIMARCEEYLSGVHVNYKCLDEEQERELEEELQEERQVERPGAEIPYEPTRPDWFGQIICNGGDVARFQNNVNPIWESM